MKKLFTTRYTEFSFNLSMFLIRIGFGMMLFMNHGLSKLQKFEERKDSFSDPLNIGHTNSLMLVIFAEAFCAILISLGLLTRLASFVAVILFLVIIFIVQQDDSFKEKEKAFLFLVGFLVTLLCGPGKWSFDKLIGK